MIICSLTPVAEQSLRKCLFTFLHLHNLDSRGEGLRLLFQERTVWKCNLLGCFLVSRPRFSSLPSSYACLPAPKTGNQMLTPQGPPGVVLVKETQAVGALF